ncbi:MAG: TonB-dependent receptor, partial [Blastocatellia bacterium]|nr:TonB-dependent receptor [Blastocatellia bacterium]
FKFGTDFNRIHDKTRLDLFFPARVIFPSLGGPGVAGPTFLNQTPVVFWWGLANGTTTRAALPIPFTQDTPSDLASLTRTSVNHNSYGFFGQDEWKVTPGLTLTMGARYDFETYPTVYVPNRDMNNVQPRVGLAYALNPRTVVRAGFGIFNDRQFTSIGQQITVVQLGSAGNQPNANIIFPGVAQVRGLFIQPTVGATPLTPAVSATCYPGGPAVMATTLAQLATCIFTTTGQVPAAPTVGGVIYPGFRDNMSGNLRTPYSEQGSLQISRELGGGVAITVGYLYVHGLKLPAHTGLLNGVQTGTLPSGKPIFNRMLGGRIYPELGDFYVTDDIGFSIYHGGSFEIEKRFARGVSFHGSYTFSKTINNAESVANLADLPEGPSIGTERAVSRQSVPHRFTLAFVSQIPESVVVLNKFKFSSLVTVQSGRRFNVFAGSDANMDGNPLSDRPGTLGRNTLEGPGFASVDLRVAREIHFSERVSAELSGDFFNLLNRVNVTDLNTVYGGIDLSAPPNPVLGFNTPRDASNPFQFQYGLKIRF